jgi:uncharacterized protein (TIGR02147 family)
MSRFDFRDLIIREFEQRKSRNARYSLRAYARDLGLQAPKLSQILKGACGLSVERGRDIAVKMNLSGEEKELFLVYLEAHFSRSALAKRRAQEKLDGSLSDLHLALEQFKIIADWHHFALLELIKLPGLAHTGDALGKRLGLTKKTVAAALERLLTLGLVQKLGTRYQASGQTVSTTYDIPSRHIQEHHAQVLQKALGALTEVPVKQRDFSTMMLALPENQVEEAKAFINEFKDKFDLKFGKTATPDRVYALGVQFFPLDKK